MAEYPDAIYSPRTKQNKEGVVYDEDQPTMLYAEDVTKDDAEIVAIETELGTNAKGAYASVKAWLTALASAIAGMVTDFLDLGDVPASYDGQAGKVVKVNATEDGLEFGEGGGGGDLVVCAFPGEEYVSGAVYSALGYIPVIQLRNSQGDYWSPAVKVPAGASAISSIKVYYSGAVSGNIRMAFRTSHVIVATPSARQDDTGTGLAQYASGGSDNKIYSITVPSTEYNGLTSIVPNDLIGIRVLREGYNALDTFEADLSITHIEFTFA